METTEIRLKCLEIATNVAAPEMLHNSMIREVRRTGSKNDVDDVIEIAGRLYDFVIEKKESNETKCVSVSSKMYPALSKIKCFYDINDAIAAGIEGDPSKWLNSVGLIVSNETRQMGSRAVVVFDLYISESACPGNDRVTNLPLWVHEV